MKWFSFNGIMKEIKKIRWPKKEELAQDSVRTIIVIAFFALFFVLCEFVVSFCLNAMGVIA